MTPTLQWFDVLFLHPLSGIKRLIGIGLTLSILSACSQPHAAPKPQPTMQPVGPPVSLAINGFNYTDLVISYFAINGNGGSNILVSSPHEGGGKTTCCVTWRPGTPLPQPVTIEWMRNLDGKRRWCTKTAEIKGPVPDRPTAIGVHFMPDGDIQVILTEGYGQPIVRLEYFDEGHRHQTGNVVHDEKVARCRDER